VRTAVEAVITGFDAVIHAFHVVIPRHDLRRTRRVAVRTAVDVACTDTDDVRMAAAVACTGPDAVRTAIGDNNLRQVEHFQLRRGVCTLPDDERTASSALCTIDMAELDAPVLQRWHIRRVRAAI